jgi:hypothetical protein
MPSFSEFVDNFIKVMSLVTGTTSAALFSAIGLLLILLAAALAIWAVAKPPIQRWQKWLLFIALIFGITFSIVGPSLALFNIAENAIPRISKDKAIERLADNGRTGWLIRVISFNPASQRHLAIDQLKTLGPEQQKFTFVAPYDELRGISVEKAVRRTGGTFNRGMHVSAIIFPLVQIQEDDILYPANARGLLQVVRSVEEGLAGGTFLLKGTRELTPQDDADLKVKNIWSWRFSQYRDRYKRYCQLAHRFRCNTAYTARSYIGGLNHDWHPLGLSQEVDKDPCLPAAPDLCASDDWETLKKTAYDGFGARVFLFGNREVTRLPGRLMIDFTNGSDVIPDIGLKQ